MTISYISERVIY